MRLPKTGMLGIEFEGDKEHRCNANFRLMLKGDEITFSVELMDMTTGDRSHTVLIDEEVEELYLLMTEYMKARTVVSRGDK